MVHTHAPMATALSCVLDELPCVHYEMLLLGGTVRVAPYLTFGTPELADAVLDALDGRTAALMANHGTVAHGADVAGALRATEVLEWAATLWWRASAVGTPRVARRGRHAGRRRRRRRPRLRSDAAGVSIVCMGVHVLDVLARPVEAIPEGQGGALVEEIRITAAGSAGGTALVLGKLGSEVRSAGAIGTDAVGDMLLALLARDGVDTALLLRRDAVQTSASRAPDPARRLAAGLPRRRRQRDLRPRRRRLGRAWPASPTCTSAGPEFMGGEAAAAILARARERGIVTSADILAPGDSGITDWIAPAFAHLDYLLPNDEQATGLSGERDLEAACRWFVDRGVGCVAATCGADGVLVADGETSERVPAFPIDVVDTTGCGDAFSAGFLRGLELGRPRVAAAALGCAAAAHVAQGLGHRLRRVRPRRRGRARRSVARRRATPRRRRAARAGPRRAGARAAPPSRRRHRAPGRGRTRRSPRTCARSAPARGRSATRRPRPLARCASPARRR